MRTLCAVIFLALAAAGCGDANTPDQPPDMTVTSNVPDCPGNVDVNPPNQVSCANVGAQCLNHGMTTLVCSCRCDHKWECDQVKLICDDDMGPPHD